MSYNLRDAMAADVEAFVSTDEFGESIEYQPAAGGPPRTVLAVLPYNADFDRGEYLEQNQETIEVVVGRNESASFGGVNVAQLGDTITLANGLLYVFTGRVLSQDTAMQKLEFARRRVKSAGKQTERR